MTESENIFDNQLYKEYNLNKLIKVLETVFSLLLLVFYLF